MANEFLAAGDDLARDLRDLNPADCLATTTDGLFLNPGCDVDVQTKGLTVNGSIIVGGSTFWLMCNGKKYWLYDHAPQNGAGAFNNGGIDIAEYFRQLKP